jgi:restriction endonuclease S subunit
MTLLNDIANIISGYLFKSGITSVKGGKYRVVQIKNTSKNNIDWASLPRTNISGVKDDLVLRDGDILFRSRGDKNQAVVVEDCPENVVAASQLFIIRLKTDSVLPAYLGWYINQRPAQQYFDRYARGSYIRLINKNTLGGLKIVAPPIEMQQRIVNLYRLSLKEKELIDEISKKRSEVINGILLQCLSGKIKQF